MTAGSRRLFGVLCVVAVAASVLLGWNAVAAYDGVHRTDYAAQP